MGVVGAITQKPSGSLSSPFSGVKEKCFYSPAGCRARVKGEWNESYGTVEKTCQRSRELNGLHAGCQLTFRLSVTICWGASRML